MKKGSKVELRMRKVLHAAMEMDPKTYFCEILRYDIEQECIYLVLKGNSLSEVSLDAVFQCEIENAEEAEAGKLHCTGRVKERYADENGQILKFEIENGFYKINIKSVDK